MNANISKLASMLQANDCRMLGPNAMHDQLAPKGKVFLADGITQRGYTDQGGTVARLVAQCIAAGLSPHGPLRDDHVNRLTRADNFDISRIAEDWPEFNANLGPGALDIPGLIVSTMNL